MNALPPRMSERLLTEYVNRLFVAPDADADLRGEAPSGYRLPPGPSSHRDGGGRANDFVLPAFIDRPITRQALAFLDRVRRRLPLGESEIPAGRNRGKEVALRVFGGIGNEGGCGSSGWVRIIRRGSARTFDISIPMRSTAGSPLGSEPGQSRSDQ